MEKELNNPKNAAETYEKPAMQVYEMEVENALMQGASAQKQNGLSTTPTGTEVDDVTTPPAYNSKSTSTKAKAYYMGDEEEE